jgi:hypothetical protein
MTAQLRIVLATTFLLLAHPALLQAGMPSVQLNDIPRMRLQTISFFLLGLLLSSGLIQLIWNRLGRDLILLPRLTYFKALGLVALWGLLFVLVLTMISGARELLTPGAWKKEGLTYKLASPPTPGPADESQDLERLNKLNSLRNALWEYTRSHDGQFPPSRESSGITAEKWQVPDPSRMRYLYISGLTTDEGTRPLVYEPEIYGPQRYVLLTDGSIQRMDHGEIISALRAGGQ